MNYTFAFAYRNRRDDFDAWNEVTARATSMRGTNDAAARATSMRGTNGTARRRGDAGDINAWTK